LGIWYLTLEYWKLPTENYLLKIIYWKLSKSPKLSTGNYVLKKLCTENSLELW